MKAKIQKKFEAIGEDLDAAADAVQCSLEDYIEGLKLIRGRLDVSIAATEESLGAES